MSDSLRDTSLRFFSCQVLYSIIQRACFELIGKLLFLLDFSMTRIMK